MRCQGRSSPVYLRGLYDSSCKDLLKGTVVFRPRLAVIQGSEGDCSDAEEHHRDLRRKRTLKFSSECANEQKEQYKESDPALPRQRKGGLDRASAACLVKAPLQPKGKEAIPAYVR